MFLSVILFPIKNLFILFTLCLVYKHKFTQTNQTHTTKPSKHTQSCLTFIFKVTTSLEKTGDNDLGVALHSAFNYVKTERQAYDALAFLTDLYNGLEEDEELSLKSVKDAFMEAYGSDVKMKDVFGEDSGNTYIDYACVVGHQVLV